MGNSDRYWKGLSEKKNCVKIIIPRTKEGKEKREKDWQGDEKGGGGERRKGNYDILLL